VKRSELLTSLDEIFTPRFASTLIRDLALPGAGSRTVHQALEDGLDPQLIWDAVCAEMDLPEDTRFHHRSDVKLRR